MNYMNKRKMNDRTMKAKRGKNRKEWMTSNGQMDKFNERHLKAFFSQNILFVHEHTWHTLICTVYRFVKLFFFRLSVICIIIIYHFYHIYMYTSH